MAVDWGRRLRPGQVREALAYGQAKRPGPGLYAESRSGYAGRVESVSGAPHWKS